MTGQLIQAAGVTTGLRLLNLGCGARYRDGWVNADLRPAHPSVAACDVLRPLPYADATFDAVYHAHLLEHLPRHQAPGFVAECRRVLRPGGALRVVVPDLEQIARLYLDRLERAWDGDGLAGEERDWLVMELFDQATRERPGGDMLLSLAREPCELAWYRLGADGAVIRRHLERPATPAPRPGWRERLLRWLLGPDYELLQIGRFRRGGEVHRWMYDRQSLRELLTGAGLVDFRVVGPTESRIPGWHSLGLDANPDGGPAKPDSLYVEAVRP